jgi:hypothetical protein
MLLKTQVGDLKGFTIEIIKNILYLIGVGYFGGSIMALSANKSFRDSTFPTDMSKLPYTVGQGEKEQDFNGDLLEYLFPMKSVGFPYNYLSSDNALITGEYRNWLIYTCMYSFSTLRLIFKKFYNFCSNFTTGCKRTLGFYLFPYLLIGLVTTVLPMFIMFIAPLNSLWIKEVDYPAVFTFSVFLGWLYPLYNSSEINFLKPFVMILFQLIMMVVFFFIQLPTWGLITILLYVYAFAILLFVPFLIKDGLKHVFSEMGHHKQSLTIYFLYLSISSAMKYLTKPFSMGYTLGSIFVAYKVLFPKKNKQ